MQGRMCSPFTGRGSLLALMWEVALASRPLAIVLLGAGGRPRWLLVLTWQ